MSVHTYGAADC